jgi:integrase
MIVHIRHGKRNRDRDVPLRPKLLETLREYWRWMRPKTYLFPGTENGWRADKPITPKVPGRPAARQRNKPVSAKPYGLTYCATALLLIWWKEALTCPRYSCCSVTLTSKPHPFTFISRSAI